MTPGPSSFDATGSVARANRVRVTCDASRPHPRGLAVPLVASTKRIEYLGAIEMLTSRRFRLGVEAAMVTQVLGEGGEGWKLFGKHPHGSRGHSLLVEELVSGESDASITSILQLGRFEYVEKKRRRWNDIPITLSILR